MNTDDGFSSQENLVAENVEDPEDPIVEDSQDIEQVYYLAMFSEFCTLSNVHISLI